MWHGSGQRGPGDLGADVPPRHRRFRQLGCTAIGETLRVTPYRQLASARVTTMGGCHRAEEPMDDRTKVSPIWSRCPESS